MVQFRSKAPARHPGEFTWGYLHPSGACPHEPPCTPDRTRCLPQPKQAIAQVSIADVLFYGGAVGGGKTEFALVEAVALALSYPNVKIALFRRTLKQHREIITRFRIMVPKWIAKFNKQDHIATFFNGSELWFGYCETEADVYNYQGEQWIALFIDEASHLTEFQAAYLITRVRSTIPGLRKRIVLTSNPGNVGHGWLKRWFIRPVPDELGGRPAPLPLEVWRPLPKDGNPTPPEEMPTRQFIPAWFKDNFALKAADPNYLAKVWALGSDKGKQLAEGDWDADSGMIVGSTWRERREVQATDTALIGQGLDVGRIIPWHVLPRRDWRPPVGAHIFGSIDYGYGAPCSIHIHASMPGGHTRTFLEFYKPRVRDVDQAAALREMLTRETFADGRTPLMEGVEWIVYDPAMANNRQEMGLSKSIAEVYQDAMPRVQFRAGAAGRGARVSRPNRWLDALSTAPDGFPWWTCTAACPDLIRTVPEIPWDPDDMDVEDDDSENHCIAAGSLISTSRGDVPIEDIRVGDYVLTRAGYRRVLRAWLVARNAPVVEVVCEGQRLRCTSDHLAWTRNGWMKASQLMAGSVLLSYRPASKNGEASATTAVGTTSRGNQAPGRARRALVGCIATSGRTWWGRFRRAITSIIATVTATTTNSPTSNASRRSPIWLVIVKNQPTGSEVRAARMSKSPTPSGLADVYDLAVEDVHEFFANGLLVHNCYEDCGRFFEARPHSPRAKEADPFTHLDPLSAAHQRSMAAKFDGKKTGRRIMVPGMPTR